MSAHMTVQNQGDAGFVILDRNGNFYARTYSSVDARLIAAAPALLEALERMTEAVDGYLHDPFKAEVAAARAAIAQAKGETK